MNKFAHIAGYEECIPLLDVIALPHCLWCYTHAQKTTTIELTVNFSQLLFVHLTYRKNKNWIFVFPSSGPRQLSPRPRGPLPRPRGPLPQPRAACDAPPRSAGQRRRRWWLRADNESQPAAQETDGDGRERQLGHRDGHAVSEGPTVGGAAVRCALKM